MPGEDSLTLTFAALVVLAYLPEPEQLMGDADVARAVDEELLALPEIERSVLVLYHQEECSYEGIAAALGLPINTVRTHLHRGRKRLAEVLRGRRGAARTPSVDDEADETMEKRRVVDGVGARQMMVGGL